ncbi:TPA: anion permease [Campylobacter jejuni]
MLAPVTPSNTARAGAIINPIVQLLQEVLNPRPMLPLLLKIN